MAGYPNLHMPLDRQHFAAVADALGDSPETAISVHQLRRGLCKVYLAGEPDRFDAVVLQWQNVPHEPMAFGDDPILLWSLLKQVEGWKCVNVSRECADAFGRLMARKMVRDVDHYGDVYHTLTGPVPDFAHQAVRILGQADLPSLKAGPRELQPDGYPDILTALREGVVACGVLGGRVVAMAHTNAHTPRYADIGVYTAEAFRGRGLCTAASAAVARQVMAEGQTPVWSAGETNMASLRVAKKLGFREIFRRVYLVPRK